MWIPCGQANIPSPKLLISLPDASNLWTVGRSDPMQLLVPHRSVTQMEVPSISRSMAGIDPHVLPGSVRRGKWVMGITKWFSTLT